MPGGLKGARHTLSGPGRPLPGPGSLSGRRRWCGSLQHRCTMSTMSRPGSNKHAAADQQRCELQRGPYLVLALNRAPGGLLRAGRSRKAHSCSLQQRGVKVRHSRR